MLKNTENMLVLATFVLFVTPGSMGNSPGSVLIRVRSRDVGENVNSCEECKLILLGIQVLSNLMSPHLNAESIFSSLCTTVLPMLGHNGSTTCPYLLAQYLPDIRSIIFNDILSGICELFEICPTAELTTEDVPGFATGNRAQVHSSLEPMNDDGNPDKSQLKLSHRQQSDPLTFVQISDIHLDRAYAKDAATECGYTICCRSNLTGEGSAGVFGNYHCDAAETTVTVLLDFIQNLKPPPAFFVYVGDNSPHVLLDTLEEKLGDNLLVNTLLVDKLRKIGPIFPALGNHEMFPTSVYSRPMTNTQTILQALSEQWPSMFKITPDQLSNIRKHAYYSALVMPGLRVLITNSLYDYLYNIYSFKSHLDSAKKEQLQFAQQTLQDARLNNEKVIFISHIKPSPFQTYPSYTDEHNQLVTDFSDVIILQLFGHEHCDVFLLNRDPANHGRVTGVSLAAPSITTYFGSNTGVNPSFRLYKLDPDTLQPLDYDQYYLDIPEANERGAAQVKKHYTFTQEYNVPDMSPSSFEVISDRK